MKFVAVFELAMAVVIAYTGLLQLQVAAAQEAVGVSTLPAHMMAGAAFLAALLLVVLAIHALKTRRVHRGTHALPFVILALAASASLFVGRAA